MSLPPPAVAREPQHTRSIRVQTYFREDGLWDLEAELIDVKSYTFERREGGVHPAGAPIHHMHLRVTIDEDYNIRDALVGYDAVPYGEQCMAIGSAYTDLVGMNLLRKFRDAVRARFGRIEGCTHLSELCQVLPTVAVQTMTSRRREREKTEPVRRPFQIDGCHAWRSDGPVVEHIFPLWYVPNTASATSE